MISGSFHIHIRAIRNSYWVHIEFISDFCWIQSIQIHTRFMLDSHQIYNQLLRRFKLKRSILDSYIFFSMRSIEPMFSATYCIKFLIVQIGTPLVEKQKTTDT